MVATNLILSQKTAQDIDKRVARVLDGLGNPEPPLRLEDVRELLKLDVKFYTANDPGLMQEVVSRIRVAAVQVFSRPALLLEAIQKWSLKALYIPDRRRIMLDQSLPALKHRWNEAHEVGHSLLPWHEAMMHGDNEQTLSRHCHEHVEAEANHAAGRLLFLRDRFFSDARSVAPTIASIRQLKDRYGNTISTTLYRFVESMGSDRAIVGMMTDHPHPARRSVDHDPEFPCRHVIQSAAFQKQFGQLTEKELFAAIAQYCGAQRGGMLGQMELLLDDRNGGTHRFYFETFYNRYDALTIGVHLRPEPTSVSFIT
nr:peptidase [Luteibacter rhizovicinus]